MYIARKLKNMENEKNIICFSYFHIHRLMNMSRKLKIIENEKNTVGREICRETLKKVKNVK